MSSSNILQSNDRKRACRSVNIDYAKLHDEVRSSLYSLEICILLCFNKIVIYIHSSCLVHVVQKCEVCGVYRYLEMLLTKRMKSMRRVMGRKH